MDAVKGLNPRQYLSGDFFIPKSIRVVVRRRAHRAVFSILFRIFFHSPAIHSSLRSANLQTS